MTSSRCIYLDIAKTIGILLVVIGHAPIFGHTDWFDTSVSVIYTFHMPLFLFISGYIYQVFDKKESYIKFISKKSQRLIIPYVTISLLLITIKLTTPGNDYTVSPVTTASYFHMLYRPEAGYFLWFIYTLWILFLIIPIFRSTKSRLILLVISTVIAAIPIEVPDYFCLHALKRFTPYFVLGTIAADYTQLFDRILSKKIIVATLFILSISAYLLTPESSMINQIMLCILPVTGTLFVLQTSHTIANQLTSIPPIIILASSSVFFIYLFHTIFMATYTYLINIGKCQHLSGYLTTILNIGMVLIGFLCPICLYYIMSKHPSFLNKLVGISTSTEQKAQ